VLPWSRSKRGASRVNRSVSRDRCLTGTFANAATNRAGSYAHGNGQMVQRTSASASSRRTRRARTYSFHQSGVAAGRPLKEGARVSFDAEQGDKGPGAVNVREL
jgi:'Cold-shock' DNA-binding domain